MTARTFGKLKEEDLHNFLVVVWQGGSLRESGSPFIMGPRLQTGSNLRTEWQIVILHGVS